MDWHCTVRVLSCPSVRPGAAVPLSLRVFGVFLITSKTLPRLASSVVLCLSRLERSKVRTRVDRIDYRESKLTIHGEQGTTTQGSGLGIT